MSSFSGTPRSLELPILHCLRCSAEWFPRKQERPLTCPKCRTPYWDKPRKERPTIDPPPDSGSLKP